MSIFEELRKETPEERAKTYAYAVRKMDQAYAMAGKAWKSKKRAEANGQNERAGRCLAAYHKWLGWGNSAKLVAGCNQP